MTGIDWSNGPITERDPEKLGGDQIVESWEDGIDSIDIAEMFDLDLDDVETLLAYARTAPRLAHTVVVDNNVPKPLRRSLSGHLVRTAYEMGWAGLQNGMLFAAAERARFDLSLTADQNLEYQQNLSGRIIPLVVLGAGRWPLVSPHGEQIAQEVGRARPGSYALSAFRCRRSSVALHRTNLNDERLTSKANYEENNGGQQRCG